MPVGKRVKLAPRCSFPSELLLSCIVMALVGEVRGQALRPVWQWIDPSINGLGWPSNRPIGENKACTCAFVDGYTGLCIDSEAHGLTATFSCGLTNVRNRAGSSELEFGMRQFGPCYCSFNQGQFMDACQPYNTRATQTIPFPSQCLPVVDAVEDVEDYMPVTMLQDYSDNTFARPADVYISGEVPAQFRLSIEVQYGNLDVFGLSKQCRNYQCKGGDKDGTSCSGLTDTTTCIGGGFCIYTTCTPCSPCNATLSELSYVTFTYRNAAVGKHTLDAEGPYLGILSILLNLKYQASTNVNTIRLKSPTLSPASADAQPYETAYYKVSQLTALGWEEVGNLTTMVRISSVNDPPVLVNPAAKYTPPAACSQPISKWMSFPLSCFFGPYFVRENSPAVLQIPDFSVSDTDLTEEDPNGQLDVSVYSYKGIVDLNTRTGLKFYENTQRNRKGFLAGVTEANNAINILNYALEVPENLGPSSPVWNYNTQCNGNVEYFTVTVGDQGYTSSSDEARQARATVNIVVIAVNQAPTIQSVLPEFAAIEDTMVDVTGFSFEDVDVDEKINSTLAYLAWMGGSENMTYLNKIAATLSVTYGNIYLGQVAQLEIMQDNVSQYITIQPRHPGRGHDLCRVNSIYLNPGGEGTLTSLPLTTACTHENAGTTQCSTGDTSTSAATATANKYLNPNCICQVLNTCDSNGKITIYLNASKVAQSNNYLTLLRSALAKVDMTCGGLPFFALPNNFSYGRVCSSDNECNDAALPKCVPGVTCKCCANISVTCSTDRDCNSFETNSFCGCVPHPLDAMNSGLCGPYTNALKPSEVVRFNAQAGEYPPDVQRTGVPCVFSYPSSGSDLGSVPTTTCVAGAFAGIGSADSQITSTLTASGKGSSNITFMGPIGDVNRALAGLSYKTVTDYSSLFRPPLSQQGALYDPTIDSTDTLYVTANDLGNSGGELRVFGITTQKFQVVVDAVNDPPNFIQPLRILPTEDLPYPVVQNASVSGNYLLTSSFDGILRLYDNRDGDLLTKYIGHTDGANGVVISSDDSYIVSCGGKYDPNWKSKKTLNGDGTDNSIRIWDLASGIQLLKLPIPGTKVVCHYLGVTSVALNDAGTIVVSGGYDKAVCLWDRKTGKLLMQFGGLIEQITVNGSTYVETNEYHNDVITSVATFTLPNSGELQHRAVSCSDDASCRVFDIGMSSPSAFAQLYCLGPASARCFPANPNAHTKAVTCMSILNLPGLQRVLVTGSEDSQIMVWSLEDFSRLMVLHTTFDDAPLHLRHVVALSTHPAVALKGQNAVPVVISVGGVRSPYLKTSYTPNPDPNMAVWSLVTGEVLAVYDTSTGNPSGKPFTALRISNDGSQVVTSSEDAKTVTWDIKTGSVKSQTPCPCLCYPTIYPDPTTRCQSVPCIPQCPRPPVADAPTLAITGNFLSRNAVRIIDPDSVDYGFSNRKIVFNISCSHCKLYLNENVFVSERRCTNDQSLCRVPKDCIVPGQNPPATCGTLEPAVSPMPGISITGIQAQPPTFGVGNRVLSLTGTMQALNLALSGLTYVGDQYFNTQLLAENLVGNINDLGAIGTSPFPGGEGGLTHAFKITVNVLSVNNPPQIGNQAQQTSTATLQPQPINTSLNSLCFGIPPAGSQYTEVCGPNQRHYIDIDEDTTFTITPDMLWINDVDSKDAISLSKLGTLAYSCSDPSSVDGCTCGVACRCGESLCACGEPAGCDTDNLAPGLLLVEMSVTEGVLSLQPPPGRSDLPWVFFRSTTEGTLADCLTSVGTSVSFTKLATCFVRCDNQKACAINVTRMIFSASVETLQAVLLQKYLTYRPNNNFYGMDRLLIWVIDQGYTDGYYDYQRSVQNAAKQVIAIRVVGVNDPPTVEYPDYVLNYQGSQPCFVDYMKFTTGVQCPLVTASPTFFNYSAVPPLAGTQASLALTRTKIPFISFADVDMDDTKYGNMTLVIQIGRPQTGNSGRFTISEVLESCSYFQYFHPTENRWYLELSGRIQNINILMTRLFFDPNPAFQGITPFNILAFDNNNFGECAGNHKCGQDTPCDNPLDAEAHKPALIGQGTAVIDVILGASTLCTATSCAACALAGNCGWCHGTCKGAGKCMIGASAPLFESCETNASLGLEYGQCSPSSISFLNAAIAGGTVGFLLIGAGYFVWRWIRRRHGSVVAYLLKKSTDFSLITSRIKLGDVGSKWKLKVFTLVAILPVSFIIEVIMTATNDPSCEYTTEFFLDSASKLTLDVDQCNIRFLSPNNFPKARDNKITAMKLKIALLQDPLIALDAATCGGPVTISLQNSRPPAIRYKNYFCNMIILVPDRYISPSIVIQDNNGFQTNVRSGSMDPDSPNFNLDFGPNSLSMQGLFMGVRLRGINARNMNFDIAEGQIFAEDMTAVTASFVSHSADIAVTTPTQTSVRFLENDGNKVCLTAANNSMYVDDSCTTACQFLPVKSLNYTNVSVSYLTEQNCTLTGTVGGKWISSQNPPYCELQCPDLPRPLVPGCVDFELCTLIETAQCLCKPTCDMVPPSQLSYDGISGVAGKCNVAGQCCRAVCAGYSKADLFPVPNMPRCGLCGGDKSMPWTDNNLAQKWRFLSESGVISFAVLDPATSNTVHSWRGSKPAATVELVPRFDSSAESALDLLFHPGGSPAPKVELFYVFVQGIGTPEVSTGYFMWLSDARYLMIPPWLFNVVTFGLLNPLELQSSGRLTSGFCPNTATDELTFNRRLVALYSLISNTLVNYPPGQPSKPLPIGSFLAYRPTAGTASVFSIDTTTGETSVSAFNSADYVLLTLIMILGIVIPFLLTFIAMFALALWWGVRVREYRREKVEEQTLMLQGLVGDMALERQRRDLVKKQKSRQKILNKEGKAGGDQRAFEKSRKALEEIREELKELAKLKDQKMEVPPSRKAAIRALTGFFYMYEDLEGDVDQSRTAWAEVLLVMREYVVAIGPTALPLYAASLLQAALLTQQCAFSVDVCSCRAKPLPIMATVQAWAFTTWIISSVELLMHLLALPYSTFRRVVRYAFYALWFSSVAFTIFVISIISVWLGLGVLVIRAKLLPYAAALLGLIAYSMLSFNRRVAFKERLENQLKKEMMKHLPRLSRLVPEVIFKLTVKRTVKHALGDQGFATPSIVLHVLSSAALLVALYAFLFIGFSAFSDPTDPYAGLLNSGVLVAVVVGLIQAGRANDPNEVGERVEDAQVALSGRLNAVIVTLTTQANLARTFALRPVGDEGFDGGVGG